MLSFKNFPVKASPLHGSHDQSSIVDRSLLETVELMELD